jgi:hypothetical protein
MRRVPVKSSVISMVGYDEKNLVLEVRFHSGRVYDYLEVPPDVVKDFLTSDSLGKYFNDVIRPRFRMKRVDVEEEGDRPQSRGPSGGRRRR